jgi:hypothetical protein
MTLSVQMRRPFVIVNDDAGVIARGLDVLNRIEIGQAEAAGIFDNRAQFAAWAATNTVAADRTYWVGGLPYIGQPGATVTGLTGLVPHPTMPVTPDHYVENVTPGTTDMLAGFTAALATGRPVSLLFNTYFVSATIDMTGLRGAAIIVPGSTITLTSLDLPKIVYSHTSGPAIRLKNHNQAVKGFCVEAQGAAAAASYSNATPGIKLEYLTDTDDTAISGCEIDVMVLGAPGDALQLIGPVFQPKIRLSALNCKGRPLHCDNGTLTGRSNLGVAIGGVVEHLRSFNCAAPAKLGNRAGGLGGMVVRWTFIDGDVDFNTQNDLALNPDQVVFDLHGENVTFLQIALGGRIAGTPTMQGMRISGRHNLFFGTRFVGVTSLATMVAAVSVGCDDIQFYAPYVSDPITDAAAFIISGAVGTVTVFQPAEATGGQSVVSTWFTAGYTKGVVLKTGELDLYANRLRAGEVVSNNAAVARPLRAEANGSPVGMGVVRTGSGAASGGMDAIGGIIQLDLNGNKSGGTRVSIADDAVATITPPRQGGFALITCNGDTAFPIMQHSAVIAFDTGDTLEIEKQTGWASAGSLLNVTTSNVTGDTGTDERVTVAVQAGVLKIENRLGFSRSFLVTFL